jgi:tetratricopeptide (TPR) repeat protein
MAGAQLYGRTYELEVLVRAVGELGQVVELVGTAGVGKSRLLDAAWDAAEGLSAYHGACTPYGAATPYSVFRPLLRSGTGISEDAAPDQAGSRLSEFTEQRAPHLLPMLPLLAVPFGARVPSTSEADAIDPAFRQARLHDVVVEFLDAVLDGPALLVVEDAHWIDTASGELVNHVIGACADRAWAIIVTRRPEGQWRGPEGLDHVRSLSLAPLDDAAIRQLAIDVSRHPLTDADLDIVSTRAQGNPLFAIELARALGESMTELPDTVEQIIASRLDHLAPEARRLVRVASVLGNQFDASIVGSIIEAEGYSGDVDEALAAASAAGAMALRSGTTWAFNHALYRDTAYEGLPFTRRRHLHRLAAEIIEQRASDTTSVAPLLSLHYAAARAHDQAWRYSLLAGAAAIAQHASSEAAAAFERALTAGRYCRQVGADDRARVAGQLGDLYYEIGRFDDATRVLTFARRVNTDPVTEVGLIRRIGSVCERQGRPDRAIQWYARAARGVPATAHDAAWSLARAEVTLAEAGIRSRRGEQAACLRLARAALTDAERSANEPVRALALERIHLATAYLRIPDTDRAGRRAVEAYRALDNSTGMARVLINLGIEAYFASDWSTASEHYLSALELAQRTGSVVLAATAAINSAEILSDQGDWARATELLDSARRNYSAVGYSAGIAAASLFAAVAAMRDGRLDEARSRLDVARDLLGRLGMAEMVDELDGRELELDALMGTATIERCRTLETRFGLDHPSTARVKRTRGILEHLAGRDDDATATLLDAVALDATPGLERALTLRALEQVAPIAPEADRWHDEADAILSTLGVRRVPPLPSRP